MLDLSDVQIKKKNDEDYLLNVTLPDGKKINILVPEDYEDYDTSHLPFGLNLVYYGHYK